MTLPNIEGKRAAETLAASVAEVFADMAFMDAVPYPEGGQPFPESATTECVSVAALKPVSVRIDLRFPPSLREAIAEALFADGEGSGGEDSVLEILNVTAGNFLIAYFGPNTDPRLELPEFLYSGGKGDSAEIATVRMLVDGHPLSATVSSVRYRY